MSLLLDLPSDLETELAAEAARLGLPLSEYAVRLIAAGLGRLPPLRTGAELVRNRIEQITSRKPLDTNPKRERGDSFPIADTPRSRFGLVWSYREVISVPYLSYWEIAGLVGTRPKIADSPAHARALRAQAERRPRP